MLMTYKMAKRWTPPSSIKRKNRLKLKSYRKGEKKQEVQLWHRASNNQQLMTKCKKRTPLMTKMMSKRP